MKLKRKRLILILLLLIILGFILEFVARPKVISQSLAEFLYKTKRYSTADKIFTRNGKDGDATASANMAKSLYKQDKYEDAQKYSEQALSKANAKASLNYDSGNIAYKQGDYQAALEHYRKALLQNPKDADTKANYELALKQMQNQAQKQAPPKQEEKEDPKKQEEIKNILGGLDNKESSDRKQQNPQQGLPSTKWW
ncbi:MAG: tetratricopeptide repeat protein [Candidatus Cloacimonetes bacterium]|nr:tetratricopeptide repeat protein [Candidatus Cloacimonadota bacterium]